MNPDCFLTFERESLTAAIHTLAPPELQLLLLLAVHTCPRTGRVWMTPLRLADELRASQTPGLAHIPPATIDAMLTILLSRGLLILYARSHGALRCYELPLVYARFRDTPPANLPVESVV